MANGVNSVNQVLPSDKGENNNHINDLIFNSRENDLFPKNIPMVTEQACTTLY